MCRHGDGNVIVYLAGGLQYSRDCLIEFTDKLEHGVIRKML